MGSACEETERETFSENVCTSQGGDDDVCMRIPSVSRTFEHLVTLPVGAFEDGGLVTHRHARTRSRAPPQLCQPMWDENK